MLPALINAVGRSRRAVHDNHVAKLAQLLEQNVTT